VDAVLDAEANLRQLPPGYHLSLLVFGAKSSAVCNLLAGKDVFSGERSPLVTKLDTVTSWEAADGCLTVIDMAGLDKMPPSEEQAARLLGDVLLAAPKGVGMFLCVLRFGSVTEESLSQLIFLLQYLFGNGSLLNLYVAVTCAPSYLQTPQAANEWVLAFAETDPGFRHLFTLVGKNPARFVMLGTPPSAELGSPIEEYRHASARALLATCRQHPLHTMPPHRLRMMREVLDVIKVERDMLDEKQYKVARLRAELELRPRTKMDSEPQDTQPEKPARVSIKNQAKPLLAALAFADDLNVKVMDPKHLDTKELCRQLEKAEKEVGVLHEHIARKLAEAQKASFFHEQVKAVVVRARVRYMEDLQTATSSTHDLVAQGGGKSNIVKSVGKKFFNAFGRKEQEPGGQEQPQEGKPTGFEVFTTLSATMAAENIEDRPPCLIFDWDDTLCPTSWMRSVENSAAGHSLKLALHVGRVEQVLRAARSFGYVEIVTLANKQWLEQTTKFLKIGSLDLQELFKELDIRVNYAQVRTAKTQAFVPQEAIHAKKAAMSSVLDRHYGDSVKARVHVLSFGDQETEAIALQEVLKEAWTKSWQRPVCKVLRVPPEPDLQDLGQNLQKILTHLPALVRVDADLDLHINTLDRCRW